MPCVYMDHGEFLLVTHALGEFAPKVLGEKYPGFLKFGNSFSLFWLKKHR